ncbi:Trm112 family protein [Streptomyces sp. NPDC017979]|uniref:Trm112 family protein n=1 Tax=unclassified Streptomyces TaxID=2593676 RepID=UPI0037A9BF2C
MALEAGLLDILACPACHSALREEETPQDATADASAEATASELVCSGTDCGLAYPVRDGIAVLLVDEARRPA